MCFLRLLCLLLFCYVVFVFFAWFVVLWHLASVPVRCVMQRNDFVSVACLACVGTWLDKRMRVALPDSRTVRSVVMCIMTALCGACCAYFPIEISMLACMYA